MKKILFSMDINPPTFKEIEVVEGFKELQRIRKFPFRDVIYTYRVKVKGIWPDHPNHITEVTFSEEEYNNYSEGKIARPAGGIGRYKKL